MRAGLLLWSSLQIFSCQTKTPPAIHLIPAGYVGPVVILYDDEVGEPLALEGNARVFRIGNDGTLVAKAKIDGRVRDLGAFSWFFVDRNGKRHPIPALRDNATDDIQIFEFESGGSGCPPRICTTPAQVGWDAYLVGKPKDRSELLDRLRVAVNAAVERHFAKKMQGGQAK